MNKLNIPFDVDKIYPLKESGSDCKFYRIKGDKPAIVLFFDNKHKKFDDYVSINNFLKKIGIGVPEIYYCDKNKKFIIEEDLGDITLQKKIQGATRKPRRKKINSKCQMSERQETEIFNIYRKVIETLVIMQILGKNVIHECPVLNNKIFDYNVLRWETSYFKQYFVELYSKIKIGNKLDSEFHNLAMKLVDEPRYFMHRDFQSQNILIKDNKIRIVDFQCAYQGLLQYDLVSLLKDPYFDIGDKIREKLIFYYIDLLKEHKIKIEGPKFMKIFLYAGLQRHMQALGAFSYLFLIKKKEEFKKYIPQALKYINEALEQSCEFIKLKELITFIYNNYQDLETFPTS